MSMTSEFAPGSNVLLLFKCELQEERSKLTRAIGRRPPRRHPWAASSPTPSARDRLDILSQVAIPIAMAISATCGSLDPAHLIDHFQARS